MGMMNKVCAFTGHRPSKLPWRYNETDSRCVALKTVLTEQITALIEAGVTQFYPVWPKVRTFSVRRSCLPCVRKIPR